MANLQRDAEYNNSPAESSEKEHDDVVRIERSESLDGLPDPDAGKSPEERAKIVSFAYTVESVQD